MLGNKFVADGNGANVSPSLAKKAATKEPATKAGVQATRERVSAELDFIGYVERIFLATKGGGMRSRRRGKEVIMRMRVMLIGICVGVVRVIVLGFLGSAVAAEPHESLTDKRQRLVLAPARRDTILANCV